MAAAYGDAELRIAPWLKEHDFFVATKTGERTYAAAKEQIQRSLERLQVDRVDLIQLHNLVDVIEWDVALSPGGALEAAIEARDEGLVRFIGVTGHGLSVPKMHSRSLARFDFDSVLCPYNFVQMLDPRYGETFNELAGTCASATSRCRRSRASPASRGRGASTPPRRGTSRCAEQADIDLAVHWVLGNPQAFLLTTGDVEILPRLLEAAERYGSRPSDEEHAHARSRPALHVVPHPPR